jgi:hypothetical protein
MFLFLSTLFSTLKADEVYLVSFTEKKKARFTRHVPNSMVHNK